jgi:hypothetical protein
MIAPTNSPFAVKTSSSPRNVETVPSSSAAYQQKLLMA